MDSAEAVPVLVTPRLRLRPFRLSDRAALRHYQMDAETMRSFGGGKPLTEAEVDEVLQYHISCRAYPYWAWVVTLKEDDVFIGQVTAGFSEREGARWIEPAWILAKEMWGQGFGTEAVGAMIHYGVRELGWQRLFAGTRIDNRRSARIMEKLGMTFAGTERSSHGHMRHIYTFVRATRVDSTADARE